MTVTTGLLCSPRYLKALPFSHNIAVRAELWLAGSLRATFSMDPSSNIQVDRTNPIRMTAQVLLTEGVAVDPFGVNVPVVPTSVSSLFSPFGSELILYRGIAYSNGDQELIKLGVIGIETFEANDTGTDLVITVSGSDRMRAVQRAGFADTYVIPPGTLITSAIQALVAASIPVGMTFNYNMIPSTATTGSTATIYQPGDDPAQSAVDLATSIGAELYFDRNGDCTCLPVPDPTQQETAWTYDEGIPATSTNIAKEVDRVVSRVNAPNYFIVIGQGTGVAQPVQGIAQDLDPSSPTWVGSIYGKVVAPPITSSLYTSVAQCQVAAQAALRLAQGTEESLTLTAIPKPDHQVDDVIEVTRLRTGLAGSTYVVDGFSMNMEPAGALALTCRSVRIGTGFQPPPPPPTAPPLPPLNLQASAITQTSFTVTWTAALDATSWIPAINGQQQPPVTTASASFGGLAAATPYTVTVDAKNAAGQSLPSAPLIVTTANPTGTDQPNPVTGLEQNGQATVSSCALDWVAPVVDGTHFAATGYTVTGGGTPVVTGTTATITGLLSATTYVFTVTAYNAGGPCVSGNPTVSVTTPPAQTNAPNPVTSLVQNGTATQNSCVLGWTAPVVDGTHSAATRYTVAGGGTAVISGTTANITGLTASTPYTFTVTAHNSAGPSSPNPTVNVTTAGSTGTNPPNQVTGLTAGTVTNTTCALSWTASVVDGSHDAATGYTVAGGGTPVVTGVTAAITGLSSGIPYTFTVTAHNQGGDSASPNPSVNVKTTGSGGGIPSPPTGAYVMHFPADFTLNPAGDYGQMMQDAVAKFKSSGNNVAGVVYIAPGTYTIKSKAEFGVQSIPPDPTLPIWWIGTAKDRTQTIFTADNATFDMVSNHINGSQFEYLTFKGTGVDPNPATKTYAGHAFSSGTHNVGVWSCAIYNQSGGNFAGRMTQDAVVQKEAPRYITGYMRNNTWSDVIISSPTHDSNATADFDFQSGLLLENIQHTGNRLDFYCVSGIFRNSTFTPLPNFPSPGFELTTGLDAATGKGIGPFLIQNFTTNAGGGDLNTAPPVGSKGYAVGRSTNLVTIDHTVMLDTTKTLEIGDTTNLSVINCKLGTINIHPNFQATGTIDSSNTYVQVNHGGTGDSIVVGGASAPPVPTGLAAPPANVTSTSITWTWNASTGATSYTPNENGVDLSTQSGTSITRTGLTPNTPYTFKVNAIGSGLTSNYCTAVVQDTSIVVGATWAQVYETPYTETSGSALGRTTPGTVNTHIGDLIVVGIALDASSATAVSSVTDLAGNTYAAIESPGSGIRGSSGATWYTIATVANAANTITVTPSISCTVAFDVVGFTGASGVDVHTSSTGSSTTASSGTTAATTNATDLVLVVEGENTKGPASNPVFVPATTATTLTDLASGFSGQRSHVVISWQIANAKGTQSFSCTDLNGTWNCSIVTFTPSGGTSQVIPPVPTGLAASNITQNSMDLSWSDSGSGTSAPTGGFPIYQGSPAVLIATATASPYHVSGLTPSTTYHFQVAASNSAGESAKCTAITPTTSASSGSSTLDTVVVIFYENHIRSKVMAGASYMAALANANAQCTNFSTFGIGPSEPNYMTFLAADHGVLADSNTQLLTGNSLIDLLEAQGLTWGSFNESLGGQDPQTVFPNSSGYDNHHNPMAHMANIYNNPTRRKLIVDDTTGTFGGITGTTGNPLINQLAAAGALPNFTYWCPNAFHEMHSGTIAAGDAWASAHFPIILNSPQFAVGKRALLIVVFDEYTPMYCVFAGPAAKPKTTSAVLYGHINVLRTIEDGLLGAGHHINANDTAAAPMSDLLA